MERCCDGWNGYRNTETSSGIRKTSTTIPKIKDTASGQFIMAPPLLREFMDLIFKSAKDDGKMMFSVELTSSILKHAKN